MPSDSPMNDPQKVWQNQPTEPLKMSASALRRKAVQRQSKARVEALFSITTGLILSVVFAWTLVRVHEVVPRIGWGLLTLWCLYFARQAYKWIWPDRLEPDATLNATLHSYRSELEKRRDYGRHVWQRAGLTLCFLGLGLVIVPGLIKSLETPQPLVNAVPVFVLLAVWFAIFFPMRRRNQQKLQQEIEELGRYETENRS